LPGDGVVFAARCRPDAPGIGPPITHHRPDDPVVNDDERLAGIATDLYRRISTHPPTPDAQRHAAQPA
jgi:hypothetical protein